MHRLSDKAIQAILKEWDTPEYNPPDTVIQEWNRAMGTLCDTFGIPDAQRAECAVKFIKSELRVELEKVLSDAREKFGPIRWGRFTTFMVAFDRNFKEVWERLPFYKKHPKRTGAVLGITGGILLAPIAAVGALTAVGFTSAGVAAGSLAATIQSIVYGGMTGGLFSLLQSVGATLVLPSVGAMLTGATTAGVGIAVMKNGESVGTGDITSDSFARGRQPGGADDDDDDDDDGPPPYHQSVPQEYILTPSAVQAIVKSWNVLPYSPRGPDAASWLRNMCKLCEEYGIPPTQQVVCVMCKMRRDCRQAANAAGCFDMTWDQFTKWLFEYDNENRTSLNGRMAQLLAEKPRI